MTSYESAFLAHAGKLSDKWEQFFPMYDRELAPFIARGAPVRLLEIGVQNGGSLEVLQSLLPAGSSIYGFDIDERVGALTFAAGIRVFVGDATDGKTLDDALGDMRFDIIIDDGSHRSGDIIRTCAALFDRLSPGGKFIIEDLCCSYWSSHDGGLLQPGSAIEWLKGLVDSLNKYHVQPGDPVPPTLQDQNERFGDHLASVSFYDSVAVIEKRVRPKTQAPRRALSGRVADVVDPSGWLAAELVDRPDRYILGPDLQVAMAARTREGSPS